MDFVNLPITALNKVGPKYKVLLETLQIYTLGDLLYHFPTRYEDVSTLKNIAELQPEEKVTIHATIASINNIFTKTGKRLTKAKLMDNTGVTEAIWFNSHFLKTVLKPNQEYSFSGKVGSFANKTTLVSPQYEEVGKNLTTGRLVPVYPETQGINSKWLNARIADAISQIQNQQNIEEFLPQSILERENFPKIDLALAAIHLPQTQEHADTGKRRFELEEMLLELLNIEKLKLSWNTQLFAAKFELNTFKSALELLESSLPFELTQGQKLAIEQILNDITKETPMNRLLEGDVGTGKTIVALFAAYLAYLNGYNVIYMAPTEILAKQHFETFTKFLEPQNINLQLITGSSKSKEQPKTPSILIGTHALLFSTDLDKVGLVIVDEQHRFGVEQRTKLLHLNSDKTTPHLLTMTATPIPRTLALTLYGDLELSHLDTPPNKDKKITTKVVPEKLREGTLQWIKEKNEQVFIVCPFIVESESENLENVKAATSEFARLSNGIFKDVAIGLLHGKMTSKEKALIIDDFREGKIKVLVSTPVIEVGIDVPEATIMVIESAERYGLASLHQLRGRVGRGAKEGFCFVFMSTNSRNSYERLKNLESVNNGLKLAEIDLRTRGHGDVYGLAQHGFKKFKLADITNTALVEKAKGYAKELVNELHNHPELEKRLRNTKGEFIGKN